MAKGSQNFIFSYMQVYLAYEDCLRHKRNTEGALEFMLHEARNLQQLTDDINNGTYEIGKSIAFVVKYPVYREVFAADFRDRIVHHLIMHELIKYFEEEFIDESFSCRKGKGVLYGVQTMDRFMKECTEDYTKDAWILKLDLKSFFMSIEKARLAQMIDEFIVRKYPDNYKKEKIRELCRMIIWHYPEMNCEKRGDLTLWNKLDPNKSLFVVGAFNGLPIGNLSSQIFANYYLTPLDKFIKNDLGFQYYGRYVDDFAIIGRSKDELKAAVPKIEEFCKSQLGITLHPDKRYFQHYKHGLKFTGSVIMPGRTYLNNRTIDLFYYKLNTIFSKPKKELVEKFIMTVNSYLGFMRHANTYKIRKWLFNSSGLLDRWYKYVEVVEDYTKIIDKEKHNDRQHELTYSVGEVMSELYECGI